MNKDVEISGKSYPLAYNLRAIILFEKLAEKPFIVSNVSDWVYLVYSCLMAANKDVDITFDEFIDGMNEVKLTECRNWITKQMEVNNQLLQNDGEAKKKSRSGKSTG